ncbi:hypothetical protein [Terasakiella sp.]|uniref:hypothetical protein n=1 Tax=Terasakiella sp. TaxID=2034861 RepID=UPI003AA9D3FB
MPHKGNEQAGVKAPAFRIPDGFSRETMPIFGSAFSHVKNCFVEWSEDGDEYAAFLPVDRAFDCLAACEVMISKGVLESAEIWPMCRTVTQGNLDRLWSQVRKLREYGNQKTWSIEFARFGYGGGFER